MFVNPIKTDSLENEAYRLLPARVDWHAKHSPHKVFALLPVDESSARHGFMPVPYASLARAVDRLCWWLESTLVPSTAILTYAGPSGIRWTIILLACIKAGRCVGVSDRPNDFTPR